MYTYQVEVASYVHSCSIDNNRSNNSKKQMKLTSILLWRRIAKQTLGVALLLKLLLLLNLSTPTTANEVAQLHPDYQFRKMHQRGNRRPHHYSEHQLHDSRSFEQNKHGHLSAVGIAAASSNASLSAASAAAIVGKSRPVSGKLPIVYVFTVVPAICARGLPGYIKHSLEQGVFSQPDCDVILVSNFADCTTTEESVRDISGLVLIDSTKITSPRTLNFMNASANMFQTDGKGELWLTSALRFFMMEDMMEVFGYNELLHVETDNLLYGRMTGLLPTLRSDYHGLAATPLLADKSFITASVFWVSRLSSLVKFNNYLLNLGSNNHMMWTKYLRWMRQYACCKPGGLDPDANGVGIKPFAVNEMSMLAYYHHLHPMDFKLLPVVPAHDYITNRYVINMTLFSPEGSEIPAPTGHGIWDPNSWGQFIGGTASKGGRDKRFTDAGHIAGQAIRMNQCEVKILCGNQTVSPYFFKPHPAAKGQRRLAAGGVTADSAVASAGAVTGEVIEGSAVVVELRVIDSSTNETRTVLPITLPHSNPSEEALQAISQRISDIVATEHKKVAASSTVNAAAITATLDDRSSFAAAEKAQGSQQQQKQQQQQGSMSFEQMHQLEVNWYEQHKESVCYTAPFVRCGDSAIWTPLWNLHVHGKQTQDYQSKLCDCPDAAAVTSTTSSN